MLPETKSKRTFVFRKYYEKYKHLWILLYFFVYMAWFNYVEKTVTTGYFAGTTVGRRNNRAGTRTEYVCMAGKNFPETDIEKYNTCRL